jgi:phosphoserine phosphatase RsbU/P
MRGGNSWQKRFFRHYQEFSKTVSSEVRYADIKSGVSRDLVALYNYYLDEKDRAKLAQMGKVRRWLYRIGWILWNLFLKLSWPRRLMLLISFILPWLGAFSFSSEHLSVNIEPGLLGYLIILVILMLELKDKLLAHDELAVGRAVQLALLPDDHPQLAGWDIWIFTRPANDVGGDLVDYLAYDDGRLGIMLGDVSGKGLGAALLMAKLQATLRAVITDGISPRTIGTRANRILCRDGLPGRFATLVYLEIQPNSDEILVMNAGHMPPIASRKRGVEELPPVSLPLGVKLTAEYCDQSIDVQPGDLVLAYSDGLSEAQNPTGEMFGEERVRHLTRQLRKYSAAEAGKRILMEIKRFIRDEAQEDDLSLVVVKRK